MVEESVLTEEEARHDYHNHTITRAIGLQQEKIDFYTIENVCKDDFVLLCTDGVTEALNDHALGQIFSTNDINAIKEDMLETCRRHSTDNYTAYVLQMG